MATPPLDSRERQDPGDLRWRLIRDLAVFVAKVGLEAVRDLLLIPVALGAGLLGLLFSPTRPDRYFANVLRLGDRFDGFVDLFGSARARQRAGMASEASSDASADALFDRLEQILRDQHVRGGVTAQAKETIDRGLDAIQRALPGEPARSDKRAYTAPDRAARDETPGENDER